MNLIQLYTIPIWESEYPEFKEHQETFLNAAKIYKDQNPTKERPRSNVNGYQSPNTLQQVEEFSPLFEYICYMCYKSIADLDFIDCDIAVTSAWLNINSSNKCINSQHTHGDTFSGVFYLKVPERSGKLVLQNIGINSLWNGCNLTMQKNQFTAESVKMEPTEGNIIIFPSYLPHSVEPNDHDEERISISFNAIALPKGSIIQ